MARLLQPAPFYGTFKDQGICIYRMHGIDYIRAASSLTGKRVKTDAKFRKTMEWANRLAAASGLASAVYAMLPKYRRKHRLYRLLTGRAMQLIKAGSSVGETVVELLLLVRLPKKKARKITGEPKEVLLRGPVKMNRDFPGVIHAAIGNTQHPGTAWHPPPYFFLLFSNSHLAVS
jgi:hypothetical protein